MHAGKEERRSQKRVKREDKEDNSVATTLLPPPSPIASATKRGRPKDDFTFEKFGAPVIPGGKKTAVVHCKHCNKKSSYL
eukprot:3288111-Ditylum_brightwellii.AAC.1